MGVNKHREYHYFEETKVLDTHNSNWSISLSNMLFANLKSNMQLSGFEDKPTEVTIRFNNNYETRLPL